MTNKKFVEELVDSLNVINIDNIRNKNSYEERLTQKFILKEGVYEVKLKEDKNEFIISIELILKSKRKEHIILKNSYRSIPTSSNNVSEELKDSIYNQVKLGILRYMIFAKVYAQGELSFVSVPILQILLEGYDKAKERIVNESE